MTFAIVHPWPATLHYASEGAGSENLLSPNPKEAFVSAGASSVFVLDLGSPRPCDTFFLGFNNVPAGAQMTVYQGDGVNANALLGNTTVAASLRRNGLRHALLTIDETVANRYFTFALSAAGVTSGVIAAGLSIRPQGFEFGGGRPIVDTSRVDRLFDGGFGIDRGATAGGWQWTMPLTDGERDRMYALALDAGIGSTVLVCEGETGGPAGNEAIHWGLLMRLEPYARQAPGENTWSMQVQDWA